MQALKREPALTDKAAVDRHSWNGQGGGKRGTLIEFGTILAGNAAVAWGYFTARLALGDILLLYWMQSVFIGVFNAVRMACLRQFSTDGFTSNGRQVPETTAGKWSTVAFFCVHYGAFHLGYLVFLLAGFHGGNGDGARSLNWLLWAGGGLFVGELIAFIRQVRRDAGWKPNLGAMMFLPYVRIVPMHLTIIFGSMTGLAAWVFIPLKTLADLGMLAIEEAWERKRRAATA